MGDLYIIRFHPQVYHLASVRLQDLCEKLDLDIETCRIIWSCFEHMMINHPELMKDRHLDQQIMCAVYVMAKVSCQVTKLSI